MRLACLMASRASDKGLARLGESRTRAMRPRAFGDAGFTVNDAAAFHHRFERNVLCCCGENPPANRQDLPAQAHGVGKISCDAGERGEKQIAEAVPAETAPCVKTVLKQMAHQCFVVGKRNHAIADVTRRKNAVIAAQAAGAAAVVGDGDESDEIGDRITAIFLRAPHILLQTAQQRGKAGTSAHDYDATLVCLGWAVLFQIRYASREWLTAGVFALRVEQFGESGVFLKKRKIFVIARVIPILRPQLDGELEILHGRIGFAGQAIESGHGVKDVVCLRRQFAGALQVLASLVPAAEIHHGDALLVMFIGRADGSAGRPIDALIADADVHLGAVGELLAGSGGHLFQ